MHMKATLKKSLSLSLKLWLTGPCCESFFNRYEVEKMVKGQEPVWGASSGNVRGPVEALLPGRSGGRGRMVACRGTGVELVINYK